MFGPMNEALRGRRFPSDGAVQNWFKMQSKNFFLRNQKIHETLEPMR
jgi:hypothetical protein